VAGMKYLDLAAWPRKEHFHFFKDKSYPHFNICANIDISRLLPVVKEKKHSFYHTIIYLVCRVANSMPEFRYRIQGDRVVEYDIVHPGFTVMNGGGPYKNCAADYKSDIYEFYRSATQAIDKLENAGLGSDAGERDDLLYLTCIPWVSFTSCMHPLHLEPPDSIPRMAWGAYFSDNGAVKLPLSVQAHHALMDGYHLGRYFEELQYLVNHPEMYF
jgi:chloramphenicol O-acetyltransferase type A